MSGVRGSKLGGLNICAIAGPEKISPIPAILLLGGLTGDAVSSSLTASLVNELVLSQISDTSSSVGPIEPGGFGVSGDSDAGIHDELWLARMVTGDMPVGRLCALSGFLPVIRR